MKYNIISNNEKWRKYEMKWRNVWRQSGGGGGMA